MGGFCYYTTTTQYYYSTTYYSTTGCGGAHHQEKYPGFNIQQPDFSAFPPSRPRFPSLLMIVASHEYCREKILRNLHIYILSGMNSSCVEINAGSDGVEHRRGVHVPSLPPGDELTPVGKKKTPPSPPPHLAICRWSLTAYRGASQRAAIRTKALLLADRLLHFCCDSATNSYGQRRYAMRRLCDTLD